MNMVQTQVEEPKETVVIDENFSTANIDIGKQEENAQPMFGNMLKSLDSTGILNMLKSNNGLGQNAEGTEGLGKLFNTLSKLQLDDPNLETTLKNDLGLDMTQISEQMNKMLQQSQENQ
jgi:hypothetical protein